MENHRLTKHIFQSDALFSLTSTRNWSLDVKTIIQHLSWPENVFENFVACDFSNVKHKTILLEQGWKRDISIKPKFEKYITLKENCALSDYFSPYYLNLIEVFLFNIVVELYLWEYKQAVDGELEMRQLDRHVHALQNGKTVSVLFAHLAKSKMNIMSC